MRIGRHPVKRVVRFLEGCGSDCLVQLSYYTYTPQRYPDERGPVLIPLDALEATLVGWADRLPSTMDLALHSGVRVLGPLECERHMALLDLSGEWRGDCDQHLWGELERVGCREAAIYRSGRSYHVYGFCLVSKAEWQTLMCRLLRLNKRTRANMVDQARVAEVLLWLVSVGAGETSGATAEGRSREWEAVARELQGIRKAAGDTEPGVEGWLSAHAHGGDYEDLWNECCKLLLRNPPSEEDVVDSRWVAHRLKAGYAALRWTSHQGQYLAEPKYWRELGMGKS